MQVKVDNSGYLEVVTEHGDKLKMCPFNSKEKPCGDWCSLFELGAENVILNCTGYPVMYPLGNPRVEVDPDEIDY